MNEPSECRAVIALLPLLAAGAANEVEAQVARQHVATCPVCRRRLAEADRLVEAIISDREETLGLPPGAAAGAGARLAAKLAGRIETQARRRRRGRLALSLVPVVGTYVFALFSLAASVPGRPAWVLLAAGAYLAASLVVAPVLLAVRGLAGKEE